MLIDCSTQTTKHLDLLKSAGVTALMRYYKPKLDNPKILTKIEAQAIISHGLKLSVVFQASGRNANNFDKVIGKRHANLAIEYAHHVIGQPAGSTIYFAVDYDATAAEVANNIIPYFKGINEVFEENKSHINYKIGAYGSGLVLRKVKDNLLAKFFWLSQSKGHMLHKEFFASSEWNISQEMPSTIINGKTIPFQVDENRVNGDYGSFNQLVAVHNEEDEDIIISDVTPPRDEESDSSFPKRADFDRTDDTIEGGEGQVLTQNNSTAVIEISSPNVILTPSSMATSPNLVNVTGFIQSEFIATVNSWGLKHFKPYEFLNLGDANQRPNKRAYQKNHYPPKELWGNMRLTAQVLDLLRDRLNAPLRITSAYRSPAYNEAIGGAKFSQHLRFCALDFHAEGLSRPIDWRNQLLYMRDNEKLFKGGIGLYSTFVHIDTRGQNPVWQGE